MKKIPKRYFTHVVEFSELMKNFHRGEKCDHIEEWVFDICAFCDDHVSVDENTVDEIHDHLRKEHHVSEAFIRTFKEEIQSDAERAYGTAYRDQYEADFVEHFEQEFTERANELADGWDWIWIANDSYYDQELKMIRSRGTVQADGFYEASGFMLLATRRKFHQRFGGYQENEDGEKVYVSQRECDENREEIFEEIMETEEYENAMKQLDPEDFEGRYGHHPDVEDENVLMHFDDYMDETPDPRRADHDHIKKVKDWIKHRVPLHKRTPLFELNYNVEEDD